MGVLTGFPLYIFLFSFDSAQDDKKSIPLQSLPVRQAGLTQKKYSAILLCCAVFIFSACTSKKKYNEKLLQKHSPAELKRDLSIIKTSLEQAHPGVYWYITKEKLNQDFKEIENQFTDSLNSLAFYRKVAPLVSEIKCGHTRLVHPGLKLNKHQIDSLKKKGLAPLAQLNYFVDGNELYIKSAKSKDLSAFKPGMQILAIDSVPAKEIIHKTEELFSSDGYNKTFYEEVLNKSFANYYKLAYPQRDSSFLVLKDSTGLCGMWLKTNPPVKKVGKSSKVEDEKQRNLAREKKKNLRKNRYKGLDESQKPLLDFYIDSVNKNLAVLTVKSFSFNHNNFHRFFRETFEEIKEKGINQLVLDLRGNGGGNLMSCNLLFRYLYDQPYKYTGRADMKGRNFETQKYIDYGFLGKISNFISYPGTQLGKLLYIKKDSIGFYSRLPTDRFKKPKNYVYRDSLIILINGYSFSATSLLAANLQYINRGKFIGEETGGGYNQCSAGSIPYLKLPNTGLKLRLPLKVIRPNFSRALEGRGVFPDVEVKNTLDGEDEVLEEAKKLISNF